MSVILGKYTTFRVRIWLSIFLRKCFQCEAIAEGFEGDRLPTIWVLMWLSHDSAEFLQRKPWPKPEFMDAFDWGHSQVLRKKGRFLHRFISEIQRQNRSESQGSMTDGFVSGLLHINLTGEKYFSEWNSSSDYTKSMIGGNGLNLNFFQCDINGSNMSQKFTSKKLTVGLLRQTPDLPWGMHAISISGKLWCAAKKLLRRAKRNFLPDLSASKQLSRERGNLGFDCKWIFNSRRKPLPLSKVETSLPKEIHSLSTADQLDDELSMRQ